MALNFIEANMKTTNLVKNIKHLLDFNCSIQNKQNVKMSTIFVSKMALHALIKGSFFFVLKTVLFLCIVKLCIYANINYM